LRRNSIRNRPADSFAYATYGLPLAAGSITTTQIVLNVLGTMEYRTDLVASYYASYLNRIPWKERFRLRSTSSPW
jgi:hypothetical protein